jgi:ADP-ribose pyrophosphatase YjhB (NUDIX family)
MVSTKRVHFYAIVKVLCCYCIIFSKGSSAHLLYAYVSLSLRPLTFFFAPLLSSSFCSGALNFAQAFSTRSTQALVGSRVAFYVTKKKGPTFASCFFTAPFCVINSTLSLHLFFIYFTMVDVAEHSDIGTTTSACCPLGYSDHSVDSTTMMTPASGRIKEDFVADESLKGSAMPTQVLTEMTFGLPANFDTNTATALVAVVSTSMTSSIMLVGGGGGGDAMPVSSSSSTCTRESDPGAFSDVEVRSGDAATAAKPATTTPIRCLNHDASDKLNAKVALQQTSRQGRSTQRWLSDDVNGGTIRLTTGCVPILRGGKILFVSSSRKPEWIIPKGGWEQDETLEESAVRECFEEAGVLGVLGPKLQDIQYETRKAKKRRLEMEEWERSQKVKAESSDASKSDTDHHEETIISPTSSASTTTTTACCSAFAAPLSNEVIARIREEAQAKAPPSSCQHNNKTTDNGSVSSSTYSQVRLALFPLYVSQVLEKWPESGRLRKAVDIDEAIEMLKSRPELRSCLQEVKDRGLHLVSESASGPVGLSASLPSTAAAAATATATPAPLHNN